MVATQTVAAIFVLYGALAVTLILGVYAIARGIVLEPPAFIMKPAELFARLMQRRTQSLASQA